MATTTFPTRALHLIDLENLVGNPRPSQSQVEAARRRYLELVPTGSHDLFTVGVNHGAVFETGYGWPEPRRVVRSGPNGADLALLGVLGGENVERRFDSVVVASGDGIFVDAVARLVSAGCAVTVVSRHCALSRRLQLAAPRVVNFDFEFPPAAPAAQPQVAA